MIYALSILVHFIWNFLATQRCCSNTINFYVVADRIHLFYVIDQIIYHYNIEDPSIGIKPPNSDRCKEFIINRTIIMLLTVPSDGTSAIITPPYP